MRYINRENENASTAADYHKVCQSVVKELLRSGQGGNKWMRFEMKIKIERNDRSESFVYKVRYSIYNNKGFSGWNVN